MYEDGKPQTIGEAFYLGMEKGFEINKAIRMRKQMIAKRLRVLRAERKLSQEALCEKIDVNRITYSGYENVRAEPSVEVLVRLAEFYDVSLDYICCRTNKPHGVYSDEQDDTKEKAEIEFLKAQISSIQEQINNIGK